VQLDNHLVTRDEALELTGQRYLTRFGAQQEKKWRFPAPKEGDLVLLRLSRISLDRLVSAAAGAAVTLAIQWLGLVSAATVAVIFRT